MVKFKVGFTITPEVLFGIISKVLPLEDLHIEQLIETPAPDADIRKFDKVSLAALQYRQEKKQHAAKLKRKREYIIKRKSAIPLQLDKGINAILLDALRSGPRKAIDLKQPLKAGGYSPNSVGSRLQNLEKHGIVERSSDNIWRIIKQPITDEMRKVVKDYHNGDEVE